MLPILKPGDEVLINPRAYQRQRPIVGDIVVLFHPHKPEQKIIKRIVEVCEDGRYRVEGDNAAASTDSRHFGLVGFELIVGRVTGRFF